MDLGLVVVMYFDMPVQHDLIGASSNSKKRMKQHNKMIVDTLAALVDMVSFLQINRIIVVYSYD